MDFKLMQAYSADVYEGEVNTLPSCVEPCHNPTISEMLLHPELMIQKRGMYDNGDDCDEIVDPWNDDLQTTMNEVQSQRVQNSERVVNEPVGPQAEGKRESPSVVNNADERPQESEEAKVPAEGD